MRQSTATVIQAEDYDLGGQGKGYVDLTPAVDHVRLVFVSGGGGSSANIDRFRIAPVDRTLAGKAVLGEATGSNTIEIGTCFAVGVPGSISELRLLPRRRRVRQSYAAAVGPSRRRVGIEVVRRTQHARLARGHAFAAGHRDTQPLHRVRRSLHELAEDRRGRQAPGGDKAGRSFVRVGCLREGKAANYPNLPLYDYAMTDVEFTPSYAT